MRFAEVPDPEPGSGQYVIAVEAAGLNFLDSLMIRGLYQSKPKLPFTPGVEAVGRIIAVGQDAPLSVGTRVVVSGQGAYAERMLVEAKATDAIPDDIDAAAAVSLFGVVYSTAWHAFHNRAGLLRGETVLVHAAAGGVGSAAVQLAVAHGCKVLATAGGAAKTAIARDLGAELAVDYTQPDWAEAVRLHTQGHGVDAIFDPVGGDVGEKSLRLLGWHGRYLTIGFAAGPIPSLAANRLLLKESSAVGVFWGAANARDPDLRPRVQTELLQLFVEHKIKPLVGNRFSLPDAELALATLAGRASVGKVVLDVVSLSVVK